MSTFRQQDAYLGGLWVFPIPYPYVMTFAFHMGIKPSTAAFVGAFSAEAVAVIFHALMEPGLAKLP